MAQQVHARAAPEAAALGADLLPHHVAETPLEVAIPGRAAGHGHREGGRVVHHHAARPVGEADRGNGEPRVRAGRDRVVVVLALLDRDELDEVPHRAVARHLQHLLLQRHLAEQPPGVAVHLLGGEDTAPRDVGELEDARPRLAREDAGHRTLGVGPPEEEGDERDEGDDDQPQDLQDLLQDAHRVLLGEGLTVAGFYAVCGRTALRALDKGRGERVRSTRRPRAIELARAPAARATAGEGGRDGGPVDPSGPGPPESLGMTRER